MIDLLSPDKSTSPATTGDLMVQAGRAADQAAARHVFADYRQRLALNTTNRHDSDLALFARFLGIAGIPVGDLATIPATWAGVSWGLVTAFQQWLLAEGYAVGSVNVRIATVKVYAEMAFRSGVLSQEAHALIRTIKGYNQKQIRHVDERRETTRIGSKKAESVVLSAEQSAILKSQPNTPTGRRDTLLMCILLGHGLRCGEVALLQVESFDQARGTFTFYRPKVDKIQTHTLTDDAARALRAYLYQGGPATGLLLQTTRKGGFITGQGMNERAITGRVAYLGRRVGITGLSAHDCRHTWATLAARAGTPINRLIEAGGWRSPAMPMRYIEAAKIANEGVILEERRNVH